MNILHIIGNGFDLNLGMKTSYKDFYEYYNSLDSSNEIVNELKKNINDNYKNWSDLELAIGKYTKNIPDLICFDDVFEDIGMHLAQYLRKEQDMFDYKKINKGKFYEYLVKPEISLSLVDQTKIEAFKNNFINYSWNVDVFTFNYTTVIDKIVEGESVRIGYHANKNNGVVFRGIEHIHGFLDNRMVLGVNDVSQIENEDFHDNIDVIEAIVKAKCNASYGHGVDDLFKRKINEANIICVFGTSLGDTDNIWWEQIGSRLKEGHMPIIIFTKGEEVISNRVGYKKNRIARKVKDLFLKKAKLQREEIDEFQGNVFVAVDSDMFKIV